MAKNKIVSISDLFAKTSTLELKDIDGNLTGVKLKVVGEDSRQFKEAQIRFKQFIGKKPEDLSVDELKELNSTSLRVYTDLIVGWENDDVFGGQWTPELAFEIFSKPEATPILEQVGVYVKERSNFFRTSKAKSD